MSYLEKRQAGSILTLLVVSMFLSALVHAEGGTSVHNLQVSLDGLDPQNHLANGTSMIVNMTLHNTGNVSEFDVTFQLLINNTVRVSTLVDEVLAGGFFTSNYTWKPPKNDTAIVYSLTLWASHVTNESSFTDNNVTKLVKVCPTTQPICRFTFSPQVAPRRVKLGENITFDASESNNTDWAKIRRYRWNFGDGFTQDRTSPVTWHIYNNPSLIDVDLTVTLTVYDEDDEHSSNSTILRVLKLPIARFIVSEDDRKPNQQNIYYVNRTLSFDASSSSNGSGYITNYNWSFGDGNITSGSLFKTITHQYRNVASVNVTLTITNNNGANDTTFMILNLRIGYPVANFTVLGQPYVNEPSTFDPTASYDPDLWNGNPLFGVHWYNWTFGDDNHTGIDATRLSNPEDALIDHTYETKGTFTVTLTVVDLDHPAHIASCNMSIEVTPKVTLKVDPKYSTKNPSNLFFNISITIEDVEDLKSLKFRLEWPQSWLPPNYKLLEYVSATNGSFLGNQYINGNQRWALIKTSGDGFAFISCNFADFVPKTERSGSGTLVTIKLQVISSGNCTLDLDETSLVDSNNKTINHIAIDGSFYTTKPVANFTWSPKPPVVNVPTTFDARASYDPDDFYPSSTGHSLKNYTWNFGDGTPIEWNTSSQKNHTFTSSGSRTVTLTVTDDDNDNCSISWTVEVLASGDITVLEVKPYVNETAGWLRMNVTVKNKTGRTEQNVKVTFYYCNSTRDYRFNTTIILNLASYATIQFDVVWSRNDTTKKGNYTILASASPVPGEIDPNDNNCTSNTVNMRFLGDVNNDEKVWIEDVVLITGHYGEHGTPGWIPADLDCDGKIGIGDVVICTGHYGKKDP